MDNGASRTQLVYDWVRSQIRTGELTPGSRIREVDIAGALGVSRTPVREAVNRLISEGQLVPIPRGLMIAELGRQQVLELYALREFLEGASARFAAQHADPVEIQNLREIIEESMSLGDEPTPQAALNKRFHAAISSAAHNRYVEDALMRMSDSLNLIAGTTYQMAGRFEDVCREHTAIVDAIEARDPAAAEQSAREHIRGAGAARMKMFLNRINSA